MNKKKTIRSKYVDSMLAAEQRTMKNYCHLFGQIADYLALAFHMLSTLQTEKIA